MLVLMRKINKYNTTIKMLGILTATLLLIPLATQTHVQIATAQQNAANTGAQVEPLLIDEIFANVESKLPGFSGAFIDDQGKLNVYLTNPERADQSQIVSVLSEHLGPEYLENGLVILKSDYAWKRWLPWKNMLGELFEQKDLGLTELDIDEKKQRIVLGFETLDEQKRNQVTGLLAKYPIPASVIELVETGAIVPITHELSTSHRPLIGAIPIGVVGTGGGYCTNGFIADRFNGAQRVSVTAGHCEATLDDLGDQQYTNPATSSTVVGQELGGTNPGGNRLSDTLLFQPSVTSQLGIIDNNLAQPYTIQDKWNNQLVGETVCKYGARTDETCGKITQTAVDIQHPDPYYGIIAGQVKTDMTVNKGDSGSPVFRKVISPNVLLYGTVWAKEALGDIPGPGIYSPIGNIEREHGALIVK